MLPIICIWSALVFIPFGLTGVAWRLEGSDSFREKLTALLAAIAIVGYPLALLFSLMIVGIRPFNL